MQIFYEAEFELKFTGWLPFNYPHKILASTLTLLTPTPDSWRVDQPLHITKDKPAASLLSLLFLFGSSFDQDYNWAFTLL